MPTGLKFQPVTEHTLNMQFNSLQFAIFLPIVFAMYWLLPHKYRWMFLLGASYYFYMSWNVKYVFLILLTTGVTYLAALLIESTESRNRRKVYLTLAAVICFGVLVIFKYLNFLLKSVNDLTSLLAIPLHPVTMKLMLPVGISFYTFQTISYVLDVYYGKVKAERNFGIYATFISFFPQLVAGPIERTDHLLPQIREEHTFSYEEGIDGLRIMLWGFFKKILIADVAAAYVDQVYADVTGYQGFDLLVVIFLFTIQIYCDFSGYSDIAQGTAKLFGIQLMQNFRSPYLSSSIQEFWRRWHISLSQWFRDYVYIPLGGSRCSTLRKYRNVMITFLLSGLWHGADWSFVLWGGLHGLLQILEQVFRRPIRALKAHRFGRVLSTIAVFVSLLWVLFRAENLEQALYVIRHALDGITQPALYLQTKLPLNRYRILAIGSCILTCGAYDFVTRNRDGKVWFRTLPKAVRYLIGYVLITGLIVQIILSTGETQFVYFQF